VDKAPPAGLGVGIQEIDLEGRGSRDILVDSEYVCSDWIKGGNCSNRGCDLMIWKQTGRSSWKKIFDKHLIGRRKFVSVDENG
jgi:hypothetical protein